METVSRIDCIVGVSAALEQAKATYCLCHISKLLEFSFLGYLKSFVIQWFLRHQIEDRAHCMDVGCHGSGWFFPAHHEGNVGLNPLAVKQLSSAVQLMFMWNHERFYLGNSTQLFYVCFIKTDVSSVSVSMSPSLPNLGDRWGSTILICGGCPRFIWFDLKGNLRIANTIAIQLQLSTPSCKRISIWLSDHALRLVQCYLCWCVNLGEVSSSYELWQNCLFNQAWIGLCWAKPEAGSTVTWRTWLTKWCEKIIVSFSDVFLVSPVCKK